VSPQSRACGKPLAPKLGKPEQVTFGLPKNLIEALESRAAG
jgi:hypothetical protein